MIDKKRLVIRRISLVLFFMYLGFLTYLLFFSDGYGRSIHDEYRYNFIPFQEIKRFYYSRDVVGTYAMLTNIAGNVLAFVPFGTLIRWVRGKGKKTTLLFAVVSTFVFSLIIESVQFITKVGVFDVDDLMLNTLGGLLGFCIYRLIAAADRGIASAKEKENGEVFPG
ncbi:MAG: VanZ family protein [Lachnospiraceae bacterium]|nr:VanZ family protein [Lachnospiraceae bacterium]